MNVAVQCAKPGCGTRYVTSKVAFEQQVNTCPMCDSSRAQLQREPQE